ncbi:MAG: iron chelate uptake ABC transporter family permease subunit, partial [Pseudomonadota bacterium]
PIAFVGLLVPHLVRPFTGVSIPKLALGSTILGACLAIFADLAGRFLLPGREVEAGVVIAMIGGPALVILVRRRQEVPL